MENKFYKVAQSGGSFVVATLFNPITYEADSVVVRDYEYGDCSRDNDEVYDMPIDKEVWKIWQHHLGHIVPGDTVEVVKGRKIPIGYTGKVKQIKPIYDRYDRWVADYVYFEEYGKKTNITNVKRIA